MSEVHGLSGAFAVDALDDAERAEFEAHLALCAECREEVAGLQSAAAMLAATTEVAPPPSLRASVLDGISAIRPLPPLSRPVDAPAPAQTQATAPTPAPQNDPATITDLASRRTVRRAWILGAGVAAAVALVVTLVLSPWQSPLSPTDAVIQAADARSYSLNVGQAQATVVRSASQHGAVIMTTGMQAAPEGKVYQLWLDFPGKGMVSAGFMGEDPNAPVLLQGDAAAATAAGITIEPAGGSQHPTTDPIAVISLA